MFYTEANQIQQNSERSKHAYDWKKKTLQLIRNSKKTTPGSTYSIYLAYYKSQKPNRFSLLEQPYQMTGRQKTWNVATSYTWPQIEVPILSCRIEENWLMKEQGSKERKSVAECIQNVRERIRVLQIVTYTRRMK